MRAGRLVLWITTAFLLVAPALAGGVFASPARAADADDDGAETYQLLKLFGDVFERVRADYVEPATDKELIEAAISGMLTSLDPHSGYLNADSYREMQVQTRGEFGGLGIEVTMENGLVKVVSPIDDTPAFRAGLEPNDLITHLDGEAVMGLTLADAVEKMRGRVGTAVDLTVRREGREPFDVTITRAIIKIRSVRSRLEGNVGYIRISSFSEQADESLRAALDDLRKQSPEPLQGIVLDLRNNPGGLLSQAVAVTDAFLDKGEVVSTGARKTEDAQRYYARDGDIADGLPIVVLINGGSASASEIVAGALQDHRRAVVLGTKSFGKGSVQTIIPLSGYGAIRLTTARYYTPSGRSIQAVGIEPDIMVEQARIEVVEQPNGRREADLRGALTNGEKTDETPAADESEVLKLDKDTTAPPKPSQDYQLIRALDLIRGISLFSDKVATTAATAQ
ncbi:MAG: S41 family peptidase [Rhodospirillales bacterium]|nr:S41 family peptidase [Rhodospirillales bacterium]